MSDAALRTDGTLDAQPKMGVRNLHNFIYCPRLFYYQWVENIFQENADTVAGSHAHRNVDQPSRLDEEKVKELGNAIPEGARLRSLRLESERLGLVGVVDIVEGGERGAEIVDYKKGSARRDEHDERIAKEPDAVQVAAHALLLRDHGVNVAGASIFYAEDKRRVPVELTEELLAKTQKAIADAKAVAATGKCPPPLINDSRCLYCSAYPICLPNESHWWAQAGVSAPQIKAAPRPENDDSEVLVVQTAGAHVGQRAHEIVVTVKEEVVRKLPAEQVRAVYLYGAVQVSTQAMQTFLEHGIDVAYFSPAGRFLGLARGLPASGVDARLGQYRLFGEPGIRLTLAREVIRAKVHNQRVMLMRNGDVPDRVVTRLAELRDATAEAKDLTALLGIEGTAAAVYFEQFNSMLKAADSWKFEFMGRNRHPPRDPINSLLSLGYSMLAKELAGVCHTVGLDPFLGFMHQPRYGRPALSLDLMEEFRPLIADSVAISLVNRGEVDLSDFIRGAAGTFLNDQGRRAFWEAYFRRMDTEVSHPQFGYTMTYRRMLEVQARQLWRFVRGEAGAYHGFTTR